MPQPNALTVARHESEADQVLIDAVLAGQRDAFATLTRRYNQRLFRVARGIIRNDAEAEDVVQQAYIRAYIALRQFRREASFGSWITRIAMNEALGRGRRERRFREIKGILFEQPKTPASSPEELSQRGQLARLLEVALDSLPEQYRLAVILRDVDSMNTSEAAAVLGITEENLRIRLHRGRAMVREALHAQAGNAYREVFAFAGSRCARITEATMGQLTFITMDPA